jgi:hypothetical protein
VTRILLRELQAQATEIATNPTVSILSATDRGVTRVGGVPYRFFELYGSFPNGAFRATTLCDGVETAWRRRLRLSSNRLARSMCDCFTKESSSVTAHCDSGVATEPAAWRSVQSSIEASCVIMDGESMRLVGRYDHPKL